MCVTPLQAQVIKYGVTSMAALQDDLCSWRHLYLAGRLQKSVTGLLPAPAGLAADMSANAAAAAGAALLLLPPTFTTHQLLSTVVRHGGEMGWLVGEWVVPWWLGTVHVWQAPCRSAQRRGSLRK